MSDRLLAIVEVLDRSFPEATSGVRIGAAAEIDQLLGEQLDTDKVVEAINAGIAKGADGHQHWLQGFHDGCKVMRDSMANVARALAR